MWGLAVLLAALLLLSLPPPRRVTLWLTVAAGTVLVVGLGALAASHATAAVNADTPFARTSLGSGLWLVWLLMGLLLADALQALRAGTLARLGVAAAALLPLAWLLASGAADELSIMKEYANRSDVFWRPLRAMGRSWRWRWSSPWPSACRWAGPRTASRAPAAPCFRCSTSSRPFPPLRCLAC